VRRLGFDVETGPYLARNICEITDFAVNVEEDMVRLQVFVGTVINNVVGGRHDIGITVKRHFVRFEAHVAVRDNHFSSRMFDVVVFALLVGFDVHLVLL
jgi:hypothetical protein